MFKSIHTKEVMFSKKPRIRTRGPIVGQKRQDTPRPTDEEFLSIITSELAVAEPKKVEEPIKEQPVNRPKSHSV